jgi:hypothetical protein
MVRPKKRKTEFWKEASEKCLIGWKAISECTPYMPQTLMNDYAKDMIKKGVVQRAYLGDPPQRRMRVIAWPSDLRNYFRLKLYRKNFPERYKSKSM